MMVILTRTTGSDSMTSRCLSSQWRTLPEAMPKGVSDTKPIDDQLSGYVIISSYVYVTSALVITKYWELLEHPMTVDHLRSSG
ncbi:hypothetical protein OAO93_03800 [Balneolaceae bacterium]|nr:hypothetical protein [Balneolaceae bacterium]